jgi:hypothetical protein
MTLVRDTLSCKIENFPYRYLGIPLSIYKLKRLDEQRLVDSVASRIPRWKGRLLNMAGRMALAKATLSAIPVHMSIALCLSLWALDQIDKQRRAFIWCGEQTVSGGRCKVAWKMVCKPRQLGGLGVVDLRRAGIALRALWEWKRWVDQNKNWGSLHKSNEKMVSAIFSAAIVSILGSGESTLFWTGNWIDGTSIQAMAPALFGAVSGRRRRAFVNDVLRVMLGCTKSQAVQVLTESMQVWQRLQQVQLAPGTPDVFRWCLTADGCYSSTLAYGAMFLGLPRPPGAKEIWKTLASPRVHFFFWLVMHGRCWTVERRFRHSL